MSLFTHLGVEMKHLIFAIGLLLPALSMATNHNEEPITKTVELTNNVKAVAGADASAVAGAKSYAEGGDAAAVANGGKANSNASADQNQTANATNAGNTQDITFNSKYQRSAPSVGQGGLYIPNCGAAGNAGGSNTGGSLFLGFAFTPADCKLLLVASAYQSLGMYDTACEIVGQTSVAKKYFASRKGGAPSCETKRETITLRPEPDFDPSDFAKKTDLKDYVTKEEQATRDKRIVEKLSNK